MKINLGKVAAIGLMGAGVAGSVKLSEAISRSKMTGWKKNAAESIVLSVVETGFVHFALKAWKSRSLTVRVELDPPAPNIWDGEVESRVIPESEVPDEYIHPADV